MKKLLTITLAVALMIPFFNSCKKGEEDPFLSLKSRDKRIQGKWELKDYEESSTSHETNSYSSTTNSSDETTTSTTTTYDGTKLKTVKTTTYKDVSSQTYTAQTVHTYYTPKTFSWTVDKGGYVTEEINEPNNTTAGTFVISSSPVNSAYVFGINNPYGTSTDDGTYNEQINNDYSSSSSSTQQFYWYWLDNNKSKSCIYLEGYGLYEIVKLSSKELILKYVSSDSDTQTSSLTGTYSYTSTGTDSDTYSCTMTFEKK